MSFYRRVDWHLLLGPVEAERLIAEAHREIELRQQQSTDFFGPLTILEGQTIIVSSRGHALESVAEPAGDDGLGHVEFVLKQ